MAKNRPSIEGSDRSFGSTSRHPCFSATANRITTSDFVPTNFAKAEISRYLFHKMHHLPDLLR